MSKAWTLARYLSYSKDPRDRLAAEELRRLLDENERLKAEVCKQVAGSHVVFDREIVEIAKATGENNDQ